MGCFKLDYYFINSYNLNFNNINQQYIIVKLTIGGVIWKTEELNWQKKKRRTSKEIPESQRIIERV